MFDIITFGSATHDTFVKIEEDDYKILKKDSEKKFLCFPFGSKIFIEEIYTSSGGGGTNTACTFANQGFKTAYCGKVGNDKKGEAVIEELKKFKVNTSLIKKTKDYFTASSIIFSLPFSNQPKKIERTILLYRGACHFITKKDILFEKIKKTKWFYLAPLSGPSVLIFEPLVKFAKKNNIKVASNPGITQLRLNKKILYPILKQLDILILNLEEASFLSRKKEEKEIIKKINQIFKGILVITKGKEGSIVYDGKKLYHQTKMPFLASVTEKTGAGDAFGSGFLSGLLRKNKIEYAIQLATANAVNCIQKIGAKRGLLKKTQRDKRFPIKITETVL